MYKGKYEYQVWVRKDCVSPEDEKNLGINWKFQGESKDGSLREYKVDIYGYDDAWEQLKAEVKKFFPKVKTYYDWNTISVKTIYKPNYEPDWKPAEDQGAMFRMLLMQSVSDRQWDRMNGRWDGDEEEY